MEKLFSTKEKVVTSNGKEPIEGRKCFFFNEKKGRFERHLFLPGEETPTNNTLQDILTVRGVQEKLSEAHVANEMGADALERIRLRIAQVVSKYNENVRQENEILLRINMKLKPYLT